MKKTIIALIISLSTALGASAQADSDNHRFDGEHRNEVAGYLVGGKNFISGPFYGFAGAYTRHFASRWHVTGRLQAQFGKQLYSTAVSGGYTLPLKYGHINFDGAFHYNRYNRWNFNETIVNLSAIWESPYVDIRIGESYIHFQSKNDGCSEPLTLTFGIGANIRHRNNPWNIGLFFRNYDEYYYENWNINWGIRFWAPLPKRLRLFGEFNIRPAGSMSQLATKYEGSVKLGLKYKW